MVTLFFFFLRVAIFRKCENLFYRKKANAGALTNFEVLDFLRSKGASKDPGRIIATVAPSELKVNLFPFPPS